MNKIKAEEIVNRFCGEPNSRWDIDHLFRYGDRLVATNGYVAAIFREDLIDGAVVKDGKYPDIDLIATSVTGSQIKLSLADISDASSDKLLAEYRAFEASKLECDLCVGMGECTCPCCDDAHYCRRCSGFGYLAAGTEPTERVKPFDLHGIKFTYEFLSNIREVAEILGVTELQASIGPKVALFELGDDVKFYVAPQRDENNGHKSATEHNKAVETAVASV